MHATKGFEECAQDSTFYLGRVKSSMSVRLFRKIIPGLNMFNPRNDLHGFEKCEDFGTDCMNLVTVISRYMQVPVTLSTEVNVRTVGTFGIIYICCSVGVQGYPLSRVPLYCSITDTST